MLGEEDDDFEDLINRMIQTNKHERPSIKKCIAEI